MNTKDITMMAMFAAIIGILGLFPPLILPFSPVPITAQTLGVMLAGSILGAKRGGGSALLVVALIAVGAPLLSGGRGGLGILLAPGGGYILAWPIAAFVIGFIINHAKNVTVINTVMANLAGGVIVIHLSGILYFSWIAGLPLTAAALSSLTFLPGDLAKAIIAAILSAKILQHSPFLFQNSAGVR
ncbi:biotin transporter BioY [Salicibibacter cibarius]|uniref:Biotin transporter n=1 Tax=Salicibibacter cibarius TaxID=2743000 RepID=A0A7T6Z3H7_9BACI|nr:biotin transporter BioY [Salicibibacter cibarius]QQK76201.1 biotin transporter BioY [Salicibibacter cibarius]